MLSNLSTYNYLSYAGLAYFWYKNTLDPFFKKLGQIPCLFSYFSHVLQ